MNPEKKILLTRTQHDVPNSYLYAWSKEVIDFAKEYNFILHDLSDRKANRKDVETYLSRYNYCFIIFNGHGYDNVITGYKNEPLIISGDNHHLLDLKIVYAVSCQAGRDLGSKCVDDGKTIAFIGYQYAFVFVSDPVRHAQPSADEFARPFKDASNKIPLTLIKGNTVKEAVKRALDIYYKELEYWLAQPLLEAIYIRDAILWNIESLQIYGDKEARL